MTGSDESDARIAFALELLARDDRARAACTKFVLASNAAVVKEQVVWPAGANPRYRGLFSSPTIWP